MFGGGDGVLRVPTEWVEIAKANNNTELKINITPNSFSLVSEKQGNRPKTLKPLMEFSLYGKNYQLISRGKVRGHWVAQAKGSIGKERFNVTAKQLREADFK